MSNIRWQNAQSGDWSRASNWNYGADPTTNDNVLFGLPGAYVVSITTPATADSLSFNAPGATLSETGGSLTLSGSLSVYNGLVALNAANSIGASVVLVGGVLAVGNGGALGNVGVLFYGGELLATTTETLASSIVFAGATTIAAATGQTLTLTGTADFSGPATATFGAPGAGGTVLWDANSLELTGASTYGLDVDGGTLVFAGLEDGLGLIHGAWSSVDIASGATLDLDGSLSNFNELAGSGTLTSSQTTLLTLGGGRFSGNLTGNINLDIVGQVEFAGSSTIGGIEIGAGSALITLTNDIGGVFNLDTSSDIALNSGASSAYFVNYGTVLRTGFAGANTISVTFFNYGNMKISAGSMRFTDGFLNAGIVEGIMSTNGGVVTLAADNPSHPTYYGGSGNDVFDLTAAPALVDSTTGSNNTIDVHANMTFAAGSVVNVQRFVVENGVTANLSQLTTPATIVMNATAGGAASVYGTQGVDTIIGGSGVDTVDFSIARASATITHNSNGTVTIGTADEGVDTLSHVDWAQFADQRVWIGPVKNDFDSNGQSDILWRNAGGDALIWKSNGSGGFTGQDLGVVNTNSQVAGIADFNGDSQSDILWRNVNGDAFLWKSNGSGGFTAQDFGVVDNSYQVAGTGDFNGDGQSDILWRNTGGDTLIWKSNGSGGFAGQDIGIVDNSYQVAGTGDFNGDGQSDILWRNTGGDTLIWKSNGSGGFTGQDLGIVDPSYQVAGIADFNGDGQSDILWRNTGGDALIWKSNGSGGYTGQDLGIVDPSYQVAGIADFNGDGKADILWRNTGGDALIWKSNGSGGFIGQDLGIVDSSYHAQNV